MIDNYNLIKQNLEFNSVSGTIAKSHPKSFICRTKENPYLLDMEKPRKYRDDYERVVVLQIMVLKDGFIVEYVMEKDWSDEE